MTNAVGTALTVEEAVPLGYALLDRLARDHGIRLLAIKGPVTEHHGLRAPRQSVDVDVLVDPAQQQRFLEALAGAGWPNLRSFETPGVVPKHSTNHRHPIWPIELDVHHWFPGFLADPGVTFERLWERRTIVEVAHTQLQAPDLVGTAAIAALHYLRDEQEKWSQLTDLANRFRSIAKREDGIALSCLAAETGAADTLRPFLGLVDAPELANRVAETLPLADWRTRATARDTTTLSWLMGVRREPWRRRPALLWRAVWLDDETLRRDHGGVGRGRLGLVRARFARLRRGLRALPEAVAQIRRTQR